MILDKWKISGKVLIKFGIYSTSVRLYLQILGIPFLFPKVEDSNQLPLDSSIFSKYL